MALIILQASLVVLFGVFYGCQGACSYAELNLDLYDCFDTRSLTTEYALPVMDSQNNAISFCSTHLSNIKSCVETAVQACSSNSNVTKFFGDGTGLSSAYTYLCNQFDANSNVEPFVCAINASASSIKGNLSDFDNSVDTLSSPTLTEICSYADTMIAAFTAELTSVCSGSTTSITIWTTYSAMLRSACSGVAMATTSLKLLALAIVLTFVKFDKM